MLNLSRMYKKATHPCRKKFLHFLQTGLLTVIRCDTPQWSILSFPCSYFSRCLMHCRSMSTEVILSWFHTSNIFLPDNVELHNESKCCGECIMVCCLSVRWCCQQTVRFKCSVCMWVHFSNTAVLKNPSSFSLFLTTVIFLVKFTILCTRLSIKCCTLPFGWFCFLGLLHICCF